MNITTQYYKDNSKEFFDSTVAADVTPLYDRFLKYVPKSGNILDLGCGSGRDTKAFLELGYQVEAIDGSEELCLLASKYTGIEVRCMDFAQIDFRGRYDAIWACASLLHISSEKLPNVLARLREALRDDGIIYMSFKYGDFAGERDGRFFLDMTEERFHEILGETNGLKLIEEWHSEDVRREKKVEWYNSICRKQNDYGNI